MTRKRSASSGFFDMPAAIAKAAVECLTPEQRAAITPAQAANLMNVAVAMASDVAEIISPSPHVPLQFSTRDGEPGPARG